MTELRHSEEGSAQALKTAATSWQRNIKCLLTISCFLVIVHFIVVSDVCFLVNAFIG